MLFFLLIICAIYCLFQRYNSKVVGGILFTVSCSLSVCLSQEDIDFHPCRIWVIVHDTATISLSGKESVDKEFDAFLSDFQITSVVRPFHFAKSPVLQRLYEIESCFSEDSLYAVLTKMNGNNRLFLSVEKVPTAKMLSEDPIDPMWLSTKRGESDSLWYLMRIDAPGAWAITHGDPDLKVALVDNGIDLTHPDLVGKVEPPHNFYDTLNPPPLLKHGTATATVLAGETVGWGKQPNGRMASIGYNTRIMFNTSHGSSPLIPCLYASTVLGAKVLSISWYYGDHSCFASTVNPSLFNFSSASQSVATTEKRPISDLLVEQEILNNGTTIVRSAGNGGHQCQGGPLYPFSGREDPRVIVVTTTTKKDTHLTDQGYSNSHYPEVDICAPGYSIVAGDSTYNGGENPSPYYYSLATSIATPIVAGVVALMHAVNPCLTPAWTESLLKKTTDPIIDAAKFPNEVGAGRINAHKAVKAALEAYNQPTDLYIRDRWDDFGDQYDPYNTQQDWNNSPDIWIRHQSDGFINQNSQPTTPNPTNKLYVYVRINSRSATISSGNEYLRLYWSKAQSVCTLLNTENRFDSPNNFLIGERFVGRIAPCKDSIFEFEWQINDWTLLHDWAINLYVQIDDNPTNTQFFPVKKMERNIIYNNDIAIKNNITIDYGQKKHHNFNLFLNNHYKKKRRFDLVFCADSNAFSRSFDKKDFVSLLFDEESWGVLKKHIVKHSQIEIIGEREVRLHTDSITFYGVRFPPLSDLLVYIKFDLSGQSMPPNSRTNYHIRQYLSAEDRLLGGIHFELVNR